MGVVIGCVTGLEDEDVEIVNEEKEEEEEEEIVGEGVAAPVVTSMYREMKSGGWLKFELLDMVRKKMSLRCRFCDGRPSQ